MAVTLGQMSAVALAGATWQGRSGYPSGQGYADELERLFAFAEREGQLHRFTNRLRAGERERYSAIAEMRVASELTTRGFRIIEWEPPGANGLRGEYLIELPGSGPIFVEVKSPDWHGQITGFKDVSRDPERLKIVRRRKQEPKYKNGGGGGFRAESGVRFAVEKAYPKLTTEQANLLIVPSDGLFVSYERDPQLVADRALLGPKGLFRNAAWEKLGGVGLAWFTVAGPTDAVVFDMTTFANPNALASVGLSAQHMRLLQRRVPAVPSISVLALVP